MKGDLVIFSDGGSRGNPGEAAVGVVFLENKEVIKEIKEKIGVTTNNVAEYTAVIYGLKWLLDNSSFNKKNKINWFLDSKLVVEQLNGRWKVKDLQLKKLRDQALYLLKKLNQPIEFTHVPREKNQHADRLVNQALDA